MVEFEMFESRSAPTVAGWAGSRHESMLWCSLPEVTAETVEGWSRRNDVEAFVLREDGHVIAYGEIWVDADEREHHGKKTSHFELADLHRADCYLCILCIDTHTVKYRRIH